MVALGRREPKGAPFNGGVFSSAVAMGAAWATLVQRGLRSLATTRIAPIHPGEVLMEDFIEGFGITQHKLAVAIGVSPRRINEIVHGKRGVTADTAMRLSRYFGTTPGFWMNLQMRYELDRAEDALGDTLSGIVPLATVEVASKVSI